MSKISKIIICCIAVIISIVSLCVPTYCDDKIVDNSFFNISVNSSYPGTNMYTYNTEKFIKYTNFSIEYNNDHGIGNRIFLIDLNDNSIFNNGNDLSYKHSFYMDNFNNNFYVEADYYIQNMGNHLNVWLNDFSVSNIPNEISIVDNYSLPYLYWYPFPNILSYLSDYNNNFDYKFENDVYCYNPLFFKLKFDIEYNNQYYYNNYFGFRFLCTLNPFAVRDKKVGVGYDTLDTTLIDNNGYVFRQQVKGFDDVNNVYGHPYVLFNNNFNYSNSYITSISLSPYNDTTYDVVIYSNLYYSSYYYEIYLLSLDSPSENVATVIYSSSDSYTSTGSTLIPLGSDSYYKSAEWWDIPSHLYNFFIYLIFDAPIISNFTNLVMVIINFIVEVFEFFIGLFAGINNIFFISIFLGIIVLIFLLKIIFKG